MGEVVGDGGGSGWWWVAWEVVGGGGGDGEVGVVGEVVGETRGILTSSSLIYFTTAGFNHQLFHHVMKTR